MADEIVSELTDPNAIALAERDELDVLRAKVLKKDGERKKTAKAADIMRYMDLKHKYEPEVKREHVAPQINLEPEGTLKGDWQRQRIMRRLITQDMAVRSGNGLTTEEKAEGQRIIKSYNT